MANLIDNRYKIIKLEENDGHISTFSCFDTLKNKYCYLSSPNSPSSWDYSINY